jgi:hypothetical protein
MLKQKSTKRAHILLPEDLAREIDALAGRRGRTAFLVETARQEVRRRKLLAFLDQEQPVWRSKDHPELAKGSGNWVRSLRKKSSRGRNSRSK